MARRRPPALPAPGFRAGDRAGFSPASSPILPPIPRLTTPPIPPPASAKEALAEPLPERLAFRLRERPPRREPGGGRRTAAVLVPLIGSAGDRRLLLTRRAADLRRQPGQIAFPGGMVDPEDPTERDAALREAHEEIGLDPARVRLLGPLDEWPTIHGFRLVPFLGVVSPGTRFAAGPEVDEIFEAPLAELLAPGVETTELVPRPPTLPGPAHAPLRMWRYRVAGREVWGITARIVRSVLDLLET